MKKVRAKNASVPVTPKIVSVATHARLYTKKNPLEWPICRDFQYAVDYETDDQFGDHDSCDTICRCRHITQVRIRGVDLNSVAASIMNEKPRAFKIPDDVKPFFSYAVNRICAHSGARDTSAWSADVRRGYYGEEVGAVEMAMTPHGRILTHMTQLIGDLTPKNCVETALIAEYGYLLDGLASLAWRISSVKPALIKLPVTGHYSRTDAAVIDDYKRNRDRWKHPVAVVVNDGQYFRLIDGRHRYIANQDRKNIPVIIGE